MLIHIIEVLIHIKIKHISYTHRNNNCAIIRLFGLFSLILHTNFVHYAME